MIVAGVRIVGGRLPFAAHAAAIDAAALATVREASTLAASRVKELLLFARDERGFVGRKDTGMAHQAVGSTEPTAGPRGFSAVTAIGPPRDEIAIVLEEGRKPGARMPPTAPIKAWALRKLRDAIASGLEGARVTPKAAARFKALAEKAEALGRPLGRGAMARVSGVGASDLDKAAESVARAVARSIGRKGIPGLHAFKRAAAIMQTRIEAIFSRHLRRALAAGGGTP